MEQFIILLIWLGMGIFGLIAKARNKQQADNSPPPGDWLDEQWQELIQPSAGDVQPDVAEQALPAPPPPLPAKATAHVRPSMRPPPVPTTQPQRRTRSPKPAPPAAVVDTNAILTPKQLRSSRRKRQTSIHELIVGKESLRRAILLREVIDRPRAYDV